MLFIKASLLLIFKLYALTPIQTRQAVENIRFLSSDGKVTYYQKSSGKLTLSKNFQTHDILESKKFSQFSIHVSSTKRKIAVSVDNSYFSYQSMSKEHDIYLGDYNSTKKMSFISKGVSPRLHLNDQYLSYYSIKKRTITIVRLKDMKKISFRYNESPYRVFQTHIEMLTNEDIYYTFISKKQEKAIYHFNTKSKKNVAVYQAQSGHEDIQFCLMKDHLYMANISRSKLDSFSVIKKIALYNNPQYSKTFDLYQNSRNDLKSFICMEAKIYFLQTYFTKSDLNWSKSRPVFLDTNNSKLTVISEKEDLVNLMRNDLMILTLKNGRLLKVIGSSSTLSDNDIQKEDN